MRQTLATYAYVMVSTFVHTYVVNYGISLAFSVF